MNFQPLGFLDVSACAAWYVVKFRERMETDRLDLRTTAGDEPVLKEWRSAKTLLAKIEAAGAALTSGRPTPVIEAHVWRLKPGAVEPWGELQAAGLRLYVPLIPSPGAMLFSGIEGANPAVGSATLVSRVAPFSGINMGPCAAVWLVADVALPDRAD